MFSLGISAITKQYKIEPLMCDMRFVCEEALPNGQDKKSIQAVLVSSALELSGILTVRGCQGRPAILSVMCAERIYALICIDAHTQKGVFAAKFGHILYYSTPSRNQCVCIHLCLKAGYS